MPNNREKTVARAVELDQLSPEAVIAVGMNGWIAFDRGVVIVVRVKAFSRRVRTRTRITVGSVASFESRPARGLKDGYLRVVDKGGVMAGSEVHRLGYIPESDPRAVMFSGSSAAEFDALVAAVEASRANA